jgi:hypothetical protein
MDQCAPKANRRTVLSSFAVISAATAAPSSFAGATADLSEWNAAMARFQAAEAAEDRFYQQFYAKADDAWIRRDVKIPAEVTDEMDRLTNEADDLRWAVMKVPAPDRAALRWKLEHILRDDGSGGITAYAHSHLDQTLADIGRLLGDA